MKEDRFVNFTTDPKGKTIAYCVKCFQPYHDWDAKDNIAYCPDCRKEADAHRT